MFEQIKSGCKSFDDLANKGIITQGNVLSPPQLSGFVRSLNKRDCNGYSNFSAGELQSFDLKLFERVPSHVLKELKDITSQDDDAIFYEFRTFKSNKEKFVHAYVICSGNNELKKVFVNRSGRKSEDVAKAVVPRIAMDVNGDFSVTYF
ncbi:MAG: hypothetical protein ACTS9Y_01210 [Methylophilus sp.]|uniref:hypothetical protein n=1 Tax=Methylophilus sp. TaxID=29541 RepID=UPI003F9FD614